MVSTSSLPPLGRKEEGRDAWNLVIKVNYGDTLKRFSTYVQQQFMLIEYDMNKLRAKICSLFEFSPDAVLVLTYTDEDGDVLALDNDDELCDAVICQRLNPLRISVQLKSFSIDGCYSVPSAVKNSDTVSDKAIPAHKGFPQLATELNSTVENSLKSFPEPIRRAFANIFNDVIQTASTTPVFSELLLLLSMMQLTNVPQSSHEPTGNPVGMPRGTPSLVNSHTSDEHKVSNDPHNQLPTVLPRPIPENIQKTHGDCHSKQCLGCITDAPVIFDHSMGKEQKEVCEVHHDGKSMVFAKLPSLSTATQGDSKTSGSFDKPNPNIAPKFWHGNSNANMLPCDTNTQRPFDSLSFLKQQGSTSHVDVLENMPSTFPTAFHGHSAMINPYKRSSSFLDSMPLPFHRAIICDGCGMHPIVGPRYMSIVFENYDLCSTCFQDKGSSDYMRIDSSGFYFPNAMKDHHKLQCGSQLPSAPVSENRSKAPIPKLDSCFIRDVTVWDGTVMSPCSGFSKIWKMRNNGTISWPFGTRLTRVRGDYLGGHDKAKLKIPETGFPVDEELDIAIDFFSPSAPGQYMSYWQMVSPFGELFGDEVWVIIQVDDHKSASAFLDLNLPPNGSSEQNNQVILDVVAEPLDLSKFSKKIFKSAASEIFNSTQQDRSAVLPTIDISQPLPPVSYPLIEIPSCTNPLSDALTEEDQIEQTLQRELEETGFIMQLDLNKEILRQNQYDLELPLEDFCGFFE